MWPPASPLGWFGESVFISKAPHIRGAALFDTLPIVVRLPIGAAAFRRKQDHKTPGPLRSMALDAYSQCPGATGKKIKFCCSDFLTELEKIDRMVEGEQYAACLQHIDLLRRQPGEQRPAMPAGLPDDAAPRTGELEAARNSFHVFFAEISVQSGGIGRVGHLEHFETRLFAGHGFLQRSFAEAKGSWSWRTYQAAETLVEAFFNQGRWVPARALLQFLLIVQRENRNVSQMLSDLLRSADVPLLLKEDPRFPQPPETAPWRDRFTRAISPMMFGDWRTTEGSLSALVADVPDFPAIWRSLAAVRAWLNDYSGSIEALRRYASLDVPPEDAVEAEATPLVRRPAGRCASGCARHLDGQRRRSPE